MGGGRWCAVAHNPAGGAGRWVRAGGCGLPELDLEGEERVEEVGADEALRVAVIAGRAGWVQVLVRPIAAENSSTICRSFFGPKPGFILSFSQLRAATCPVTSPPVELGYSRPKRTAIPIIVR